MWDFGFLRLKGYGSRVSPWIQTAAGTHRLELLGLSLGPTDRVEVQFEHEQSEGVSVTEVRAEVAGSPATLWVDGAAQAGRSRLRVEWQVPTSAVIRIRFSEHPASRD